MHPIRHFFAGLTAGRRRGHSAAPQDPGGPRFFQEQAYGAGRLGQLAQFCVECPGRSFRSAQKRLPAAAQRLQGSLHEIR